MVERRIRFSSVTCIAIAKPTGNRKPRCEKVWKVWQCSSSGAWQIMARAVEHARRDASCDGIHRAIITPAMRKYIAEMDETGLAPRHIWSGLRRYTPAPPINGVPSYTQVARCVKTLRAKHGERNGRDALKALVREFPLSSGIDADKLYVWCALDKNGFPRIGKGEDHDPFVLEVTTVGLLEKLKRFQQLGMFTLFHIDATFKLSEIGYPVITLIELENLAAIFVVSRLTHVEYSAVLSALMQVYYKLFAKYPRVDAVLGDAEDAQFNALQSTPPFQRATFLMCFFHVLYNVQKRTRQLSDAAGTFVLLLISPLQVSATRTHRMYVLTDLKQTSEVKVLYGSPYDRAALR
ncbi:hypothetical protein PHMEG_00038353 [Phytophthora megakarya]|uniref:MULE transposase domain-containing protein n=1 Tax=Phytophthora megakarya TaxID=4795 RepID=A0A225UHB5_9STRA|nr:hypothetical protein PHMEG_00038353 [Phytophthora megakarya]